MAVIAMTREMATLGKDVAAGLAEQLGIDVVHHELVEHDIAEQSGMRESEVHRFLEGESSLFERWKIDSKRLSRYTAEEILALAAKGNVLIRGWGAGYLLRSVPHVVSVRVCAPMSFREQVLMQRLGTSDRAAARREIERNDAGHNAIVQKMFAIDWQDATHYAIVLNTARFPVDQCVDYLVRATKNPAFQETAQSRGILTDELILSRVRAILDRSFGSGPATLGGIDAMSSAGRITLSGAATCEERTIVEAVRLLRNVEGVTDVDDKIVRIPYRSGSWS